MNAPRLLPPALVVSFLATLASLPAAPEVSNVLARQLPGEHRVEVTYDLANPGGGACTVEVQVSTDGGDYGSPLATSAFDNSKIYYGTDYGTGVSPGTGKTLTIKLAEANLDKLFSRQVRFKIVAISEDSSRPVGFTSKISTDGFSTYFIKENKTLWAMGWNPVGQLGNGTEDNQLTPVLIASNVERVSAGELASFYYRETNKVYASGFDSYFIGETSISTPIEVGNDLVQISIRGNGRLFIKSDLSLWGVGSNSGGQLGLGTMEFVSSPQKVSEKVVQVSTGLFHTLFLKSDGELWAMGDNRFGQLGDGTTEAKHSPVLIDTSVRFISTASYSFAGCSHYIKSDDSLWAMGSNGDGQLGDGTTKSQLKPVKVADNVEEVSTSRSATHVLFIKKDLTMWASGSNAAGQLTDGTTAGTASPKMVGVDIIGVAAGSGYSLFVKKNGSLWAVGDNSYGQLGAGDTEPKNVPVRVADGL